MDTIYDSKLTFQRLQEQEESLATSVRRASSNPGVGGSTPRGGGRDTSQADEEIAQITKELGLDEAQRKQGKMASINRPYLSWSPFIVLLWRIQISI